MERKEKTDFAFKLKIPKDGLKIRFKDLKGLEILTLCLRIGEKVYRPLFILTNGNKINLDGSVTMAKLRLLVKTITEIVNYYYGEEIRRIIKAKKKIKSDKEFVSYYHWELKLLASKFVLLFFAKYKNIYKVIPYTTAIIFKKSGYSGRSIALNGMLMSCVEQNTLAELTRVEISCYKCKHRKDCLVSRYCLREEEEKEERRELPRIKYSDLEIIYINHEYIHDRCVTNEKQRLFIDFKQGKTDVFLDKLELIEENESFAKLRLRSKNITIVVKFENVDRMPNLIRLLTRSIVLGRINDKNELLVACSDLRPYFENGRRHIGETDVRERLREISRDIQECCLDIEFPEGCPVRKLIDSIEQTHDLSILNVLIYPGDCFTKFKFNICVLAYLVKKRIINKLKIKIVLLPEEVAPEIIGCEDVHIFMIVEYNGRSIVLDPSFYTVIDPTNDRLEKFSKEVMIK